MEPSYQCARYLGRAIWRRWSGYHRQSRVDSKMLCVKLMRQSLTARDFDRQVATIQIRIAELTRCCARGKPVAAPTGTVCLGQGAIQPSTDLCSKLHRRESPSACVARSPCCGAENPAAIAGFVDNSAHLGHFAQEICHNILTKWVHSTQLFAYATRYVVAPTGQDFGARANKNKQGMTAVGQMFSKGLKTYMTAAAAGVLGLTLAATEVAADGVLSRLLDNDRGRANETYVPTIWVDPDGCEHWVMDDGAEGYMTPHVNRKGIPVCRRGNMCGTMNTDQFFATDSARISKRGRDRLATFFKEAGATSYIIVGHTDSRASDAYNLRLSYNRANSVAKVAAGNGARIADVRGMGERVPVASNGSSAGMAKNRRVEIICIR